MKQNKWFFKRPTIMIDWDDVIVETLPYLLSVYNEMTDSNVQYEWVKQWNLNNICDMRIIRSIFRDPDFWRNIPEKDNAFRVIQEIINDARYDIFICTACQTKQEFDMKYEVLQKHIPGFNMRKIISLVDKDKFRADCIVDDGLHNLDACKPYVSHCIVMDMPHNQDADKDYIRIKGLSELPEVLEDCFFSNR